MSYPVTKALPPEKPAEASFGVLLHGIGNSLAHWLTAVGLVLDETVPDAAGRYKAIILSDSARDGAFTFIERNFSIRFLIAASALK